MKWAIGGLLALIFFLWFFAWPLIRYLISHDYDQGVKHMRTNRQADGEYDFGGGEE